MKNAPAKTESMTKEQALEAIKKDHPDAHRTLQRIIWHDVVTLGTDEAFALRSQTGEIKAFKHNLKLSASNGGLIQPVPYGNFCISAVGYEMWRNAVGASVIPAKEVLVNGEWKNNPYRELDDAKNVVAIHARAIVFGYSPKGLPIVLPWTTIYDVVAYRMIDLLAKAKKNKDIFRALPTGSTAPKEEGTWAKYVLDPSVDLWANTSHNEWFDWASTILNRQKKAMDFAQTFVSRNATKHFSGLQKVPGQGPKENIDAWNIPVIAWRPTSGTMRWDQSQYAELQNRIEGVITGEKTFDGEGDLKMLPEGRDRASDEVGYEIIEAEMEPEDAIDVNHKMVEPKAEKTKKKTGQKKLSEAEKNTLANLGILCDDNPGEYEAACKLLKLEPKAPHTPETANSIMKAMEDAV